MDLDAELDLFRDLLRAAAGIAEGVAFGVRHAVGGELATREDPAEAAGAAAADRVLGRARRVAVFWDGSGGRAAVRAARRHRLPVLFVVDRQSRRTPALRRLRQGIAVARVARGDASAAATAVAGWSGDGPLLLWAPSGDVDPVAVLRARLVARGVPDGTLELLANRTAR